MAPSAPGCWRGSIYLPSFPPPLSPSSPSPLGSTPAGGWEVGHSPVDHIKFIIEFHPPLRSTLLLPPLFGPTQHSTPHFRPYACKRKSRTTIAAIISSGNQHQGFYWVILVFRTLYLSSFGPSFVCRRGGSRSW